MSKYETNYNSNWYELQREAIQRTYGKDWKLFCGILASTSPNSQVKANLFLAKKAYHQLKTTGLQAKGFLGVHFNNIVNYLETGTLSGRKVNAFYQNLIGNEIPVTVDIWIARYFKLKVSLTPKQYSRIERLIQHEAKKQGITPANLQAKLWVKVRKSSSGYAEALQPQLSKE